MPGMDSGKSARTGRLSLRTTARQDALIRRAAAESEKTISEFVLDSACTNAEHVLADRTRFVIDDKRWRAFQKALDRPARVKPRLARLMRERSVAEDV